MDVYSYHVAAAVLYAIDSRESVASDLASVVEAISMSGLGKNPQNGGGNTTATLKSQLRYRTCSHWFRLTSNPRESTEDAYVDVELVAPDDAIADPSVRYVLRHPTFLEKMDEIGGHFAIDHDRLESVLGSTANG